MTFGWPAKSLERTAAPPGRRTAREKGLATVAADRPFPAAVAELGSRQHHASMIERIRQMFSKAKPTLSDEARDFITKLADSDIWILAIGIRGTPAMPSLTDPAAFDVIAANRMELSEVGDDDSVFPFNYERDGRQVLPFFRSEERARHFLDHGGLGDISLWQPFRLLAGFVATPENEQFELVLDTASPSERRLSQDERLLLRALSTAA